MTKWIILLGLMFTWKINIVPVICIFLIEKKFANRDTANNGGLSLKIIRLTNSI